MTSAAKVASPATAPATGEPKRYPKGLKRRQQILDRAIEVFAEVGFEGASLRAIGEAIGVSHAALRRYFETREVLFLAVLQEKDRQALVEAQERDRSGLGLAESLEDYASKVPGLMALRHSMVARALEHGGERSREFFVERYEALREETLRSLELGAAAGYVRADIPLDAAAAVVVATLDGLSTQWLLDSKVDIHRGIVLLEELLLPASARR
jgi:AcrR family transcriptional regulator